MREEYRRDIREKERRVMGGGSRRDDYERDRRESKGESGRRDDRREGRQQRESKGESGRRDDYERDNRREGKRSMAKEDIRSSSDYGRGSRERKRKWEEQDTYDDDDDHLSHKRHRKHVDHHAQEDEKDVVGENQCTPKMFQVCRGRVSGKFGKVCFVDLDGGSKGVIHDSEMTDNVSLHQKVFVKVISVSQQLLGLSMRDVDQTTGVDDRPLSSSSPDWNKFVSSLN